MIMWTKDTIVELFRQMEEGGDIPPARQVLSRLTPELAATKLPNWPYSILTNLAHAVFWQNNWLAHVRGERAQSFTNDWRVPDPSEFGSLRKEFLDGFAEARRIAESQPFDHKMKSDDIAIKTLMYIAIHNSYHLGQMNLLKRQLRLNKP
jgi:uncharacterized damage-inducible protein DinB